MKFEIGDRVEVISQQENFETVGLLGTVQDICMTIGVEHDCEFYGGYDLNGLCKPGYGLRYFDAEN